jgi:two-component system, OmpR family, response regulator
MGRVSVPWSQCSVGSSAHICVHLLAGRLARHTTNTVKLDCNLGVLRATSGGVTDATAGRSEMIGDQKAARILVVDDDEAVRVLLRECFELEGFQVTEATNGKELSARLAEAPTDLITLDLNLGGENGFDIARQVRAVNNVPIVMITGKGDTIDRIVGLELGADDYIAKPFHVREVVARVRAVLRRYEGASSEPVVQRSGEQPSTRLVFDGWTLDTGRRELRSDSGSLRDLTTAEFNLLLVLAERPRRVLSRDTIMDLLKGHDCSPFDRSIDSLIVRLRKKIEREADAPRLIKSVRGIGYVFAADVRKS